MKLYEIAITYQNILMLIEDGEASWDQMRQALNQLGDELETKADNIAKILKQLEGDAKTIKDEEDRLKARRQSIENNAKNLKQYLEDTMFTLNKKKFKTDLFSFNIQKNPPSLEVIDEKNIPDEYYQIERKLMKKDLLKDMKEDGVEIEGVSIKQTESLRIR